MFYSYLVPLSTLLLSLFAHLSKGHGLMKWTLLAILLSLESRRRNERKYYTCITKILQKRNKNMKKVKEKWMVNTESTTGANTEAYLNLKQVCYLKPWGALMTFWYQAGIKLIWSQYQASIKLVWDQDRQILSYMCTYYAYTQLYTAQHDTVNVRWSLSTFYSFFVKPFIFFSLNSLYTSR